jgi:hypothetical protein
MDVAGPRALLPEDRVGDDELLYRRVREQYISRDAENKPFVSANAFNDKQKKPSVDRAHLTGFDPQRARWEQSDAIVSLLTEEVRAINSIIERTATGTPVAPYLIDVRPDPLKDHPTLPDNPAHAQIQADRDMTGSAFSRLKEVLAQMISPVLDPHEPVVYLTRTRKVYHTRTCHHLKKSRTPVPFHQVQALPCCACRPDG